MSLALVAVLGCSAGANAKAAHANAPGLSDDTPLRSRGGSNPNAPFALLSEPPHLSKRAPEDVADAMPCRAKDLSVFESGSRVKGTERVVRLSLVNHGPSACRLGGYPQISLLRHDGSRVGDIAIEQVTPSSMTAILSATGAAPAASTVPAEQGAVAPEVVLTASGGEAAFSVGWTAGPDCDEVSEIVVAAPGSTQSFTVNHAINVCAGRIQVTAIGNDGKL